MVCLFIATRLFYYLTLEICNNMSIKLLVILAAISTLLRASPIVLISAQDHHPIINSQSLLAYLNNKPSAKAFQLNAMEDDLAYLRTFLKSLNISKEKISSFFTSPQKIQAFKNSLSDLNIISQQITFSELPQIINDSHDVVLSFNVMPSIRLLQTSNTTNSTTSQMFDNLTPASLSGLWVGLFLLIMLGIALSCLFNLKTHEKFARQNLWVGRES